MCEAKQIVPNPLTVIKKCDISNLSKINIDVSSISAYKTISCPFPPYNFNEGPKCWHIILIYPNMKFGTDILRSCIAFISSLFALKTYYSTFIVESNGFGSITVLISLTYKTAITPPENFVFDKITPTIHPINGTSRSALDFLLANFKNADGYKERHFLTNSDMILKEFLNIEKKV
jgi:hypothetical protein